MKFCTHNIRAHQFNFSDVFLVWSNTVFGFSFHLLGMGSKDCYLFLFFWVSAFLMKLRLLINT